MRKKGVSPIIASVLLLAVSISVVGIFSGWAPNLVQGVTEETENSTYKTLGCNEAGIEIRSAFYDTNSGDLTVSLRNTGPENLPKISVVAYTGNQTIIDQTETNITSGEVKGVTFNAGSQPSYVEALSTRCSEVTYTLNDIET